MDELVARETVDLLPYVSWEKDVIEEKVEFSRRVKSSYHHIVSIM